MKKQLINDIFVLFEENNPTPSTELVFHSDYELLIAVILSAQATDVSVNKATKYLFQVASTPEKMIELGEEKLIDYIKSIGLFRSKAKHIIQCSYQLIEKFNRQVPNTRKDLENLAGVGRKTANVVLNTLYDEETIAVDTHVFRVSNRLGIAKGKTPLEVEQNLDKNIPTKYKKNAHHWLVLHGRYICKSQKPLCSKCFLSHTCKYFSHHL